MAFENLVEDGRVRRSRETRARLIEATWTLLGEGNWRPTAREIARRTGVSQRTVFAHFGTLNDLMTDRIHMMFGTGTGVPPLVKDGRIRALATLLVQRSPLLPEVPTGAEAKVQGISIEPWAAIFDSNLLARYRYLYWRRFRRMNTCIINYIR